MTFTKVGQSSATVQKAVYTIDNRHLLFTPCLILILTDNVLHCTLYTGISLETALLKTGTTVLCWKRSPLELALIRSLSSKPRHACQTCTQTHAHTAQGVHRFLLQFLWWYRSMFVDTRSRLAFELSVSSPQRIVRWILTNAISEYSWEILSDTIFLFLCLAIDRKIESPKLFTVS